MHHCGAVSEVPIIVADTVTETVGGAIAESKRKQLIDACGTRARRAPTPLNSL